jgi:hypothetical protein
MAGGANSFTAKVSADAYRLTMRIYTKSIGTSGA